ncbi:MAG: effector-associated domain EAD1-containing protein [Coleofasciculaceae cyanobacterium]
MNSNCKQSAHNNQFLTEQVMKLTGKQYEELQKAIESAFPIPAELERMVRFKLETNLRTITSSGSLSEIIFELIGWAESEGRVSELITKACDFKPGNLRLKTFAEQFFTATGKRMTYEDATTQNPAFDSNALPNQSQVTVNPSHRILGQPPQSKNLTNKAGIIRRQSDN